MSEDNNYLANLDILKKISAELSDDTQIDIDQLLPKIESAIAAYNNCKTRLDSIESAIKEKLDQSDFSED